MIDAADFKDNSKAIVNLIQTVIETTMDSELDGFYRDRLATALKEFPTEFINDVWELE